MSSRKLIVEIIGDDQSLRGAYARSSKGTAAFNRDISRATRGALAGSGIFRGLGRSIAFASGGFLAFATGGQFIRTSIDAAKDALVTQKQLGTQLRNDGRSFKAYRGEIDKTGLRISALSGFTKEDLDQALTTILRSTKNVGKALRDEGTAADLARARHISLSQAALILGKTEAGNTTLLRRQGFQIGKNVTAEEALAIVRAKVRGQARAGTTEQERFGAVLHDSEVIIGAGLLPTLNQYLARGAAWLTQMNESGRLQKDVASITGHVTHAFHDAGVVAKDVSGIVRGLNKVTGDTEHTLLGFAGVWLLIKKRMAINWALTEAGLVGTGTAASTASTEVGVLGTRLAALRSIAPIAIPITLLLGTKQGREITAEDQKNAKGLIHDLVSGDITKSADWKKLGKDLGKTLFGGVTPTSPVGRLFGLSRQSREFTGTLPFPLRPSFDPSKIPTPTGSTTPRRTSLQGQFNIAELKLARAQLTATNADDIRILKTEAAITREQIAHVKSLKDKTSLTQRLVGIMGNLKSITKEASDSFVLPLPLRVSAARAGATLGTGDDTAIAQQVRGVILRAIPKLHGEKLISAYEQLGQVNQQLADAITKTITPIKLQIAQARAALTPGLSDDLRATVAIRDAAQKALKSGKLSADGVLQALNTIAQANDQIGAFAVSPTLKLAEARAAALGKNDQLVSLLKKDREAARKALKSGHLSIQGQIDAWDEIANVNQQLGNFGPQTDFVKANTKKLLAGLGLDPAQERAARARLSQLGAGGKVPRGSAGAPSAREDVVVVTQFQLDGRTVAVNTTRHQDKRRKRNPGQRRGPHAGI